VERAVLYLTSTRKTKCHYCPDPIPANSPHAGVDPRNEAGEFSFNRAGNPYWQTTLWRFHLGCLLRAVEAHYMRIHFYRWERPRTMQSYVNSGDWA
jgi:hypothetical protein